MGAGGAWKAGVLDERLENVLLDVLKLGVGGVDLVDLALQLLEQLLLLDGVANDDAADVQNGIDQVILKICHCWPSDATSFALRVEENLLDFGFFFCQSLL